MNAVMYFSVSVFSPGQVTGIVLMSVLIAALIALNVWLAVLIRKRGEHKLHTAQLRKQRKALLTKLNALRSGEAEIGPGVKYMPVFVPVGTPEEEAEKAEEEAEEQAHILAADEADESEDDEEDQLDLEVTPEGNVVRYNRSFTARLTQADNDLKARYSELKNYIMAFRGVKARMSWRKETFHIGRRNIASFVISGKTLCINLATDPKLFDGTKYKVTDMTGNGKKPNPMPCRFRITSDRRTGYTKELLDIVMAGFGSARRSDYAARDFTLPYKSTEALVKRRLIKIVGDSIPDYAKEDALAASKRIRYNRSFEARIIQSDEQLKGYYSVIKNHILGFEGVKTSGSWKKESFVRGKTKYVTFVIRGKTLCVCMALDPAQFAGTKYRGEDLSLRVKKTDTPLLYRIKSPRRLNYAMQLIDRMFAEAGVIKIEREKVNYVVPFVATETLMRRGLIKMVKLPAKGEKVGKHSKSAKPEPEAEPDLPQDGETAAPQDEQPTETAETTEKTETVEATDKTEATETAETAEATESTQAGEADASAEAAAAAPPEDGDGK